MPAPYEGRPWFLPIVGEWYRLQDRLGAAVASAMRIGFRTSPQNTDWASLEAAWAEAGQHDVFDSGWLNDHLTDPGRDRGGPSFEAMTTLAALAHHVPGKSVGQTVLAATFRHPAMLAKEAVTLDHLTGGRYILALGAGWHVGEHESFGIDLPPIARAVRPLRGDDPGAPGTVQRRGAGSARRDPGRAAVPARWRRDGARAGPARRPGHLAGRAGTARPAPGRPLRRRLELRLEPGRDARRVHRAARPAAAPRARRSGATRTTLTLSVQIIIPAAGEPRRAALERAIAYGRAGASEILLTTLAREGAAGIRRLATEVAEPLKRDAFG